MSTAVYLKLLAIFAVVALGWVAARLRWLGEADPAPALSAAAFYIFLPALLFRAAARIDLARMPWGTLAAFFVPAVLMLLGVYAWQRRMRLDADAPAAGPGVRAIAASFGNTLQIGIPVATALFGEPGLAIHVAIISLHAITLLSIMTALVEFDLVRERRAQGGSNAHVLRTVRRTARQTIVHPVVLPVLAGLAWNALLPPLPQVADETLQTLGQAAVPLCLVLIGLSLARHGVREAARGALATSALKLLALPALVLAVGHGAMGLAGLPLQVIVMAAALPAGANALIFSQRYRTLEGETSAAVVLSTFAFGLTAPLWLAVLSRVS